MLMGGIFSLPCFSADTSVSFDKLPTLLLLRMVRILLCEDPQAVCRLLSSSRVLRQLVHADSQEAAELSAARSLLTQQRLFELRVAAGLEAGVPEVAQSISRQLSIVQLPPEPTTALVLRRTVHQWRVDGAARGRAVSRFLRVSSLLTQLYFWENEIGDSGAAAIAEALKVNGALTELSLDLNCIGDAGTAAIAEALSVNSAITTLRMDDNKIGDEGAIALGKALELNGVLAKLVLRRNLIGDAGAAAIAAGLRVNGALTELDLSRNSIGDEGAKSIGDALRVNRVLMKLDLGHNRIGGEGAAAIATARRGNGALTFLSLGAQGMPMSTPRSPTRSVAVRTPPPMRSTSPVNDSLMMLGLATLRVQFRQSIATVWRRVYRSSV